jgi:osmotically-inducible protein OsmY
MVYEKNILADQIYVSLLNDPRTEDVVADVIDENGIITLVGEVDSEKAKQAAYEVASSHPDVVAVFNNLVVSRN